MLAHSPCAVVEQVFAGNKAAPVFFLLLKKTGAGRGSRLATRLAKLLGGVWGHDAPAGVLDVSMHRDDIGQRGIVSVQPTEVPFNVEGRTIVLVDDVLFNGRTVRAALDAVHHLGRPRRIQLAVLVDRGHRELPIKPDYVGKNIPTAIDERIEVSLSETGGNDSVTLQAAPPHA